MILTREQLNAAEADGEFIDDAVYATARAYHDLRDGVNGLCEAPVITDPYTAEPRNVVRVGDLRAVVARVEENNG